MGTRIKRFRELLPGLNEDKLFKDFPQVVMMDLKKVSFGKNYVILFFSQV